MRMEEIFPEIFVAVSESGAANLGFVIGKKGVVVIDTSLFRSKAEELRNYISSLTRKPILAVFNTHYHPDHTFGNSAFDSPIIAHEITRLKMESMNEEYIDDIRRKMGEEMEEEFRNFELKIPTETFKRTRKIDLGNRSITFLHVGGHTEDSSIAIVEPEMVIFCGDILVNGYHPEIVNDSNLDEWIDALRKLLYYDVSKVVPGHGEVGGRDSIERMLEYMETLGDFVKNYEKRRIHEFIDKLGEDENFIGRKFPELLLDDIRILLRMEKGSKNL